MKKPPVREIVIYVTSVFDQNNFWGQVVLNVSNFLKLVHSWHIQDLYIHLCVVVLYFFFFFLLLLFLVCLFFGIFLRVCFFSLLVFLMGHGFF